MTSREHSPTSEGVAHEEKKRRVLAQLQQKLEQTTPEGESVVYLTQEEVVALRDLLGNRLGMKSEVPESEVAPLPHKDELPSTPASVSPEVTVEAAETVDVKDRFAREIQEVLPLFQTEVKKLYLQRPDIAYSLYLHKIEEYLSNLITELTNSNSDLASEKVVKNCIEVGLQSTDIIHRILNSKLLADAYFSQTAEMTELAPLLTRLAKSFCTTAQEVGITMHVGFDQEEKIYLQNGDRQTYPLKDIAPDNKIVYQLVRNLPHIPEVLESIRDLNESKHKTLLTVINFAFGRESEILGTVVKTGAEVVGYNPSTFRKGKYSYVSVTPENSHFSETDNIPEVFSRKLQQAVGELDQKVFALQGKDMYNVLQIDKVIPVLKRMLSYNLDTDEALETMFTSEFKPNINASFVVLDAKLHTVLRAHKLLEGYYHDEEYSDLRTVFKNIYELICQAAGYANVLIGDINISQPIPSGMKTTAQVPSTLKPLEESFPQQRSDVIDIKIFPVRGVYSSQDGEVVQNIKGM